jgi:hypothetical protein
MARLNLNQANERTQEEFAVISRELGPDWEIGHYMPLKETPDKLYTAKGGAFMFHNTVSAGRLTTILFQPGDNTGNQSWVPRQKEGEAELYISIGSSVDGGWFPGLTHLVALDSPYKSEEMMPQEMFAYKELTTPFREYLERLGGYHWERLPRRLDFTHDKERSYGNPHVIGFSEATDIGARPHMIDYQIGAFINFPEPCEELEHLREKTSEGFLHEGAVRGDIRL